MTRKRELAREILHEVLEKVDSRMMVKTILLEEVGKVGGRAAAEDSMEAVLSVAWTII